MSIEGGRVASAEMQGEPAGIHPGQAIPIGMVRSPADLAALLASWDEPAYRARQIHRWVFGRGETDPERMTDLPRDLRERIRQAAWERSFEVVSRSCARDGTSKALLRFSSGGCAGDVEVESVAIPAGPRMTLCVSSQGGCAVGCPFCATGTLGLRRNLEAPEIAAQMLWAKSAARRWPTHVVFMGMGEPLANLGAVRAAVELMRSPDGFGLGIRRITLSTSGVVPGILRLAAEPELEVNLAVSLHAASDELRDRLVPLNRRWPLPVLMDACRAYTGATRRRISFEYVMLAGVNDRPAEARRLAMRLSGMLCHVNLIPYNPVPPLAFEPSPEAVVRRFARVLEDGGVTVTVRLSRGREIDAACGQLGARRPAGAARGREEASSR